MSTVAPQSHPTLAGLSPDALSSLFQAIGGLRNRRALAAMAGCLVVAVVIGALGGGLLARGGGFGALLTGLVVLVIVYTGVNASGILLMDQARGNTPRPLVDALVQGLMCIPKVIALALGFFLVALGVFLAIAIVFLVCKIPGLGPVLFAVAFPLAVLVAGLAVSGLALCMFLALPAIWEGASITHAIAQAIAIVRSRIVEAFLMLLVVGFLAFVVGFIVFGVLGSGLFPTMGLSAAVLGGAGGMDYGGGMRGGMGMGGFGGMMAGGGAYVASGAVGFGVLWAIAVTLVAQVWLLGLNLVYLRVSEGLDTAATEAAIAQKLAEARRKSAEMANRAKEAAERARDQARAAATPAPAAPAASPTVAPAAAAPVVAPPPAPVMASTCPACRAPIAGDDVFCGACGHRLR